MNGKRDRLASPNRERSWPHQALPPAQCSAAGVGTAHVSAAEVTVPIKSNRLKLLWASVCPWKREIRISVHAAGIFIAAPMKRTEEQNDQRGGFGSGSLLGMAINDIQK